MPYTLNHHVTDRFSTMRSNRGLPVRRVKNDERDAAGLAVTLWHGRFKIM